MDFCVHALTIDGLRVAPFEQHREGSGRLRGAGLTEDLWRRWYHRIVEDRVLAQAEGLWPAWQRSEHWPPDRELLHQQPRGFRSAFDLWDGPDRVLAELLNVPHPRPVDWMPIDFGRSPSGHPDPLWDDLQRFRGHVPHFWIFVIDYPAIVYDVIAPAGIVMSHRILLNPPMYRHTLLTAVEQLAQQ